MRWALATSVRRPGAALLLAWRRDSASRARTSRPRCAAVVLPRRATRAQEEQPRCVIRCPRRDHVRAAARCRRPPSLTRHAAALPCRPAAAQQGDPLPRRPSNRRGDRRRHARRRRPRPRPPPARPDRRPVARRPAHQRGAHAHRGRPRSRVAARCSCDAARAAAAARSAWTTGPGNSSRRGCRRVSNCRSGRCSASSPDRRADGRGRPPPPARSCAASPARRACGDASRRISCGTPTPSRWHARACR